MKIGITGAQSVGKTTLLNALRSENFFEGYDVCVEATRRVKSYGLPINEGGTDVTQRLIMNEHIYNVFMFDNMLTDRIALDGLVYTTYLHRHGQVSENALRHVKKVFKKIWPHYDRVFYIAPEFDIEDDGTRSIDIGFRDEIASLFEEIIESRNLQVQRIGGTVRQRVATIINNLEGSYEQR